MEIPQYLCNAEFCASKISVPTNSLCVLAKRLSRSLLCGKFFFYSKKGPQSGKVSATISLLISPLPSVPIVASPGPQLNARYSQASSINNPSISTLMRHGCTPQNPKCSFEAMQQAACMKSELLCSALVQPQAQWQTRP